MWCRSHVLFFLSDELKIISHRDVWDSIENNAFLSPEGVLDVIGQVTQLYATPDLKTPKYEVSASVVRIQFAWAAGRRLSAGAFFGQGPRNTTRGVSADLVSLQDIPPRLWVLHVTSAAGAV